MFKCFASFCPRGIYSGFSNTTLHYKNKCMNKWKIKYMFTFLWGPCFYWELKKVRELARTPDLNNIGLVQCRALKCYKKHKVYILLTISIINTNREKAFSVTVVNFNFLCEKKNEKLYKFPCKKSIKKKENMQFAIFYFFILINSQTKLFMKSIKDSQFLAIKTLEILKMF